MVSVGGGGRVFQMEGLAEAAMSVWGGGGGLLRVVREARREVSRERQKGFVGWAGDQGVEDGGVSGGEGWGV